MRASVGDGKSWRVWLDGVEITKVFEADEEGRYVVQADLDERGRMQIDMLNSEIKTVKRYGHVRIERNWT